LLVLTTMIEQRALPAWISLISAGQVQRMRLGEHDRTT
jgi:hypothetical protein